MKKLSKLEILTSQFHFQEDEPDLNNFGIYRVGLTFKEIDTYLMVRGKTLNIKRLRKKFWEIAGVNTMGVAPNGEPLMYRWDVQRFADSLFFNQETYFD